MSPMSSKNWLPKIRSRRSFSPGQWQRKCSTDSISSSSSQLLQRSLMEIPSRIAIFSTAMCSVMIPTRFRRLCLLNVSSFSVFSLLRLGYNVLEIKQPSRWEYLVFAFFSGIVVICSWMVFKFVYIILSVISMVFPSSSFASLSAALFPCKLLCAWTQITL